MVSAVVTTRRCRLLSCLVITLIVSLGTLMLEWRPVSNNSLHTWMWDSVLSHPSIGGGVTVHAQSCAEEDMSSGKNRSRRSFTWDAHTVNESIQPFSKDALEKFRWSAGGVRGMSAAQYDAQLNTLFERVRDQNGALLRDVGPCSDPFVHKRHSQILMLEKFIVETSLVIKEADHAQLGDDCRYRLPPHQRAICLAMAVIEEVGSPGGNNASVALHELEHYRHTNCRVLAPCADWARGRFSVKLSPVLLQQVYEHVVLPSIVSNASRALAVQAYSQQLLHGEGNMDELPWLMRRSKTMELDLEKRRSMYYKAAPPVPQAPRRRSGSHGLPPNLPPLWSNVTWLQTPTNMLSVLRGSPLVGQLPPLSPLEMLASLWVMVGPSLEGGTLNVMVFNGDSVNREVFHRLIHFIRFGDDTRPTERDGNGAYFPHLHYATHYDMVYAVHPEYDELLGFHSPQTNGSSTYTVERYFRAVRRNVTRWQGSGGGGEPPIALLYIVWFWDPFTGFSRGLISSSTDTPPTSHCDVSNNASHQSPLVAYGVRPAVLIQGTGFWERQQGQQIMDLLTTSAFSESPLAPRRLYLMTAPSEELLQDLGDAVPPFAARTLSGPPLHSVSLDDHPLYIEPQDRVHALSPHYNLLKNQEMFSWLFNTTLRQQQQQSDTTATSTTVQLLDKAKVQFMHTQHVLRDKIHFTCRATFAYAKPRFFEASMSEWSITRLLLPFAHPHFFGESDDMWPRPALNASYLESLASSRSWCNVASATPDGVSRSLTLSSKRVGRFWFKLLRPSRLRYELWSRLGLETYRIRGPIVTGVLLPRALLHPELVRSVGGHVPQVQSLGELDPSGVLSEPPQVYVNVDSPRIDCSDDGDNILLHTLVQAAVVQKR